MLDHLVGKPSANWKRIQVVLTLLIGAWIMGNAKTKQLPRFIQQWSQRSAGQSPWRIALGACMAYYLLQNLFLLVGLNAPEPLARLYKRSFYRATWILTALDAGFFTAQSLRPVWLRHTASFMFSIYYLMFADAAEDKVRRVRATMSVDQMRLSWEKGAMNPILRFFSQLQRPRLSIRTILSIERGLDLPPTELYLFYHGEPATLADHDTILLQFPGGGFVSMPPPCHEDALAAWAKQTGLPVCSVNYRKAPEYPYPWPVEECFDLYLQLIKSRGRIIGLSGEKDIKIIVLGDSAGGNLAASVTLKILAHNQYVDQQQLQRKEHVEDRHIPVPAGVIMIYPALDFELSCWMTPSTLSLIRAESTTQMIRSKSLQSLLESKNHLSHSSPLSVVPDVQKKPNIFRRTLGPLTPMEKKSSEEPPIQERVQTKNETKAAWETSRLAMTSRMSFFNDRIITPDMMRAMAILYLGPHAHPDFESDYLLSPVKAPLELLAQFPKTYMICGEKDPFVDDTVIFAGRIRQAKHQRRQQYLEDDPLLADNTVRVKFLEGMSHAFMQMFAFLPEAHQAARTVGDWVLELAEKKPSKQGSCNSSNADESSVCGSSSSSSSVASSDEHQQEALLTAEAARNAIEMGAVHVAQIVTSEKDMIHRRKKELVSGLYSQIP